MVKAWNLPVSFPLCPCPYLQLSAAQNVDSMQTNNSWKLQSAKQSSKIKAKSEQPFIDPSMPQGISC